MTSRNTTEFLRRPSMPTEHCAWVPLFVRVCGSIKTLLNRAGIDCSIVIGTSKGGGHAWNIVRIDGEYYHLDTTYNDPVFSNGDRMLVYHYFNLTDRKLKLTTSGREQIIRYVIPQSLITIVIIL